MRALAIVLILAACKAPERPAPVDTVPEALLYPGPALTHATTPAGMSIAFHEPDEGAPSTVALLLPRGHLHDGEHPGAGTMSAAILRRAGLSRLHPLGPMGGDALMELLETLGADLTVDAEAEHFLLRSTGPAEQVPKLVAVLCGLAFHPAWSEETMDGAFNELMDSVDDRRHGSNVLVQDVLMAELFKGHALANPALPSEEALTSLQLADVAEWQARARDPSRALMLIAGGKREDALAAATLCSRREEPPSPERIPPPAERNAHEPVRIHVQLDDGETAYVRVGSRGPPSGTPESAALNVVMEALANGFSSELVQQLRVGRGVVYGVEGGLYGSRMAGMWFIGTSTSKKHARDVAEAIEQALDHVHANGISDEKWRRIARGNALAFAYGREAVTELMSVELDNFILGLPPNGLWRTPQMLWRMEPRSAWDSVRRYLEPSQRVVVVASDEDVLDGKPHQTLNAAQWP